MGCMLVENHLGSDHRPDGKGKMGKNERYKTEKRDLAPGPLWEWLMAGVKHSGSGVGSSAKKINLL